MRRDDRVDALLDEVAEGDYVFPDYGGYCFAGVPGACLSVLDARPPSVPTLPADVFADLDREGIENVLLVLVDGLGYDGWRRAEDDDRIETPLLSAFSEHGTVSPLTSLFPSETASAIPTLHTGRYPIEHGQLGWWQYVDGVGAVQSLPYLTPDDVPVRDAYPDAPDPSVVLYDADPLYPRVAEDVRTSLFEPREISEASQGFSAGADRYVGYETVPHLAVQLRRALEGASGAQYLYAYLPHVDGSSHRDGPRADETDAQLESILETLRRQLCERLDPDVAGRTLLVLSADHGHVDTGGINVDLRGYDPLWDALARGPEGDPIPPVGSSRQLQLHLRDDRIEAVGAALERDFDCRTFTRSEYESRDLFGPGEPGPAYERHAPDLLCVHRENGMWYDDGGLREVGKHGGLTREEMLVPFGVLALGSYRTSTP